VSVSELHKTFIPLISVLAGGIIDKVNSTP
jgi:hypothetical protein